MALGSYPDVGLKKAHEARDAAKEQETKGVDLVQARKLEKLKNTRSTGDTFKAIALEWYAKQSPQWSASHAERTLRQLERDLFPWIGERPIAEIHSMELLKALHKVEERGAVETADRVRLVAGMVWEFEEASGPPRIAANQRGRHELEIRTQLQLAINTVSMEEWV
ncbi:prophage integrase IntS [Comamonadaceae bacterium OS-4]|nr:prophage integrase IntS [Comamonadaceae bacterium OS-4]